MERKLIDREVPKLKRGGSRTDRLLGVFVASVVPKLSENVSTSALILGDLPTGTYPDIKASLHQNERQDFLSVCEAYPYLAVHQEAMV